MTQEGTWVTDGVKLNIDVSTTGYLINPNQKIPIDIGPTSNRTWGSTTVTNIRDAADNAVEVWGLQVGGVGIRVSSFYVTLPAVLAPNGHRLTFGVDVQAMGARTTSRITMRVNNNNITYTSGFYSGMPTLDWITVMNTITYTNGGANPGAQITFTIDDDINHDPEEWGVRLKNVWYYDQDAAPPVGSLEFGWHSMLCDIKQADIRYGRDRFTERYDVATCNLELDNVDGEYIYRTTHPFNFRPGRYVRLTAEYAGTTFPIYWGVIDTLQFSMQTNGKASVIMGLLDTTHLMAGQSVPSFSPSLAYGSPYLSGARINDLVSIAGITPSFRSIDAGAWRMAGISANGRTVRDEAGLTADSEGGSLFANQSGVVTYKDRTWPNVDARLKTIQAIFNAVPNGVDIDEDDLTYPITLGAPLICPFELATDWSRDRLINKVTIGFAGGYSSVFEKAQSQQDYGVATYQRTDFVWQTIDGNNQTITDQLKALYPVYAQTRADDYFATSQDSTMRFVSVSYKPSPSQWAFTFRVFLNWVVRISYYNATNPDSEWGFSSVVSVQSVSHRITPNGWTVILAVDEPKEYDELIRIPVVPATSVGWDGSLWDIGIWDQTGTDVVPLHGAYWNSGQVWNGPGVTWLGHGWDTGAKWDAPEDDWKA